MGSPEASLEELLEDDRDFLRVRGLPFWEKNSHIPHDPRSHTKRTRKTTNKTERLFRVSS